MTRVAPATTAEVTAVIESFAALSWPTSKSDIFPLAAKTSWDRANRGRLAVPRVNREVLRMVMHEQFADVERFEESRGIRADDDPLAGADA